MKNTTSTKKNTSNSKAKNCSNSKSTKGTKNCSNSKSDSSNSCDDCPGGVDTDPLGSYTGNPRGFGKYAEPVEDACDK